MTEVLENHGCLEPKRFINWYKRQGKNLGKGIFGVCGYFLVHKSLLSRNYAKTWDIDAHLNLTSETLLFRVSIVL